MQVYYDKFCTYNIIPRTMTKNAIINIILEITRDKVEFNAVVS